MRSHGIGVRQQPIAPASGASVRSLSCGNRSAGSLHECRKKPRNHAGFAFSVFLRPTFAIVPLRSDVVCYNNDRKGTCSTPYRLLPALPGTVAIPAVNRSVPSGHERNLRFFSALRADSVVSLPVRVGLPWSPICSRRLAPSGCRPVSAGRIRVHPLVH